MYAYPCMDSAPKNDMQNIGRVKKLAYDTASHQRANFTDVSVSVRTSDVTVLLLTKVVVKMIIRYHLCYCLCRLRCCLLTFIIEPALLTYGSYCQYICEMTECISLKQHN
jgi:hypothetical protein